MSTYKVLKPLNMEIEITGEAKKTCCDFLLDLGQT